MSSFRDRVNAQRKHIAESRVQGEKAYKFMVGKTMCRVLPGVQEADDFSKIYAAHYIKDPATKATVAVVGDAEICYGKPCPVRQAIGRFVAECSAIGDVETAKFAKDWIGRESYVVNLEIIGGPDAENKGKVVRAELSKNQYDQLLSVIDTIFMGNPDFDMRDGLGVVVERVGTGVQDTKYRFEALPLVLPPPTAAILDQRVDLQTYVDSKFGASVERALTKLSLITGADAPNTSGGQAMLSNVQTKNDTVALVGGSTAETTNIVDADYTPMASTVEEVDPMAAILAEIEGIGA